MKFLWRCQCWRRHDVQQTGSIDIVEQQSGCGIFGISGDSPSVPDLLVAALAECERLPLTCLKLKKNWWLPDRVRWDEIRPFFLGSMSIWSLSALLVAVLYLGGWELPISGNLIANWLGVSRNEAPGCR